MSKKTGTGKEVKSKKCRLKRLRDWLKMFRGKKKTSLKTGNGGAAGPDLSDARGSLRPNGEA